MNLKKSENYQKKTVCVCKLCSIECGNRKWITLNYHASFAVWQQIFESNLMWLGVSIGMYSILRCHSINHTSMIETNETLIIRTNEWWVTSPFNGNTHVSNVFWIQPPIGDILRIQNTVNLLEIILFVWPKSEWCMCE